MELFKLLGYIGVDNKDAINGINSATDAAESAAGKFGNFLGAVGEAAKKTAIVVGTAFASAAAGVGVLTKQAVSNYAEYEQLVGGAELMFGEAYDFVADKAANAYATVQMSQSEYLQQVNGFATGLKTALNGDAMAAAELADRIVVAEADIVAATGASSESVQNAFNGIMKSNFTMVDNLQLGIKPTKEGFQEMIDSVNAYNASMGNMTNYTIDNLADCQNALVDYVAMQGMANYALNEGATTISGSIATMKASWMNLVTGLADPNADIGQLIDNMVTSAKGAIVTLKPAIQNALSGIGTLISELAPIIAQELPTVIYTLLPDALSAIETLLNGVMEALPTLLNALSGRLYFIISSLTKTITAILPDLIVAVVSIIVAIAQALTTPENVMLIITAIGDVCQALADNFMTAENIAAFVQNVIDLISAICTYFSEHGYEIGEAFMTAMATIIVSLSESGLDVDVMEWIGNFSVGIIGLLSALSGNTKEETDALIQTLGELGINMKNNLLLGYEAVKGTFSMMWGYLTTGWNAVKSGITGIFDDITAGWEAFKGGFDIIVEDISTAIDAFIELFDFDISFPDIKLPHFSVSGGVAPYGIGGSGSLPSISVEWYAKGGIIDGASIFGANGNNLMVGGEAGKEAIIPLENNTKGIELIAQTLQRNMTDDGSSLAIQNKMNEILDKLDKLANLKIVMDTGDTVGALAPSINSALGDMSSASDRGRRATWL